MIILPFASNYNHLVVFSVLYGCFEGTIAISLLVTVLKTATNNKQRSFALGLWLTSCAISMAAAPPLIGALVDKFGSYSPGFYLSGAFLFIGGIIPLVRTNQCQDESARQDSGSISTVETYLDENVFILEKLSVV
ncbi:Monocarboxylate transporter 10 [Exaiptasia diaphana]|nr:Monocarboxylate transporter 10 [Exaiptasia diaphana]